MIGDTGIAAEYADWLRTTDTPNRPDRATLRMSSAGACLRQRWYAMHDADKTDPPDDLAEIVMAEGRAIHESVQAFLVATRDAFAEVPVDLRPQIDLDGTADAADRTTVYEIKTQGKWAYEHTIKSGPRDEHLLQAACYASALDLLHIELIYVNREDGRMMSFRASLYEDALVRYEGVRCALAVAVKRELEYCQWLTSKVRGRDWIPARFLPITGLLVNDPGTGPFNCRYCSWRTLCMKDGA